MGEPRDFKNILKEDNLSKMLEDLNIEEPENNVFPEHASTHELMHLHLEMNNKVMNEALKLLLPTEGDQNRDLITKLMERNNLGTRMLQQRHQERGNKAHGSYFDPLRKPICEIPEQIKQGKQTTISDSALKLIQQFEGDSANEEDNLRTFLRSLFDVARTNGLTETCTKTVLRRKLAGTARILIDTYEAELGSPDKPTLLEIVLKLEDRYLSNLQPNLANARLATLKKTADKTYQKLEAEINELVFLAARGQKGDTTSWSITRRMEVFKAALNEKDRSLLYQENQSRSIAGLPDLTLSQAVDFLIKTTAETNAFQQSGNASPSERDAESIMRTKETKDVTHQNKKSRKEKRSAKKAQEEEKIKDELFQLYEKQKTQQYGRNRGRGGYQRGRNFNRQQPSGGQNGNGARHKTSYQPRKFTTPQMANVDPYNCLKCNSPDHRFTEVHKCVYGHTALMTKPCMNCKVGAHPTQMCIKSKNSIIGAPPTPIPNPAPPNTPVYTKWSDGRDANKRVEEAENYSQYSLFPQTKNEQRLSLFPPF